MARPRTPRRRTVVLAVTLAAVVGLAPSSPAAMAADVFSRPPPGPVYRPPVDGPIIDHFRPPACSWCPGNRGIDYAVAPGTQVRASAPGVVTFAGAIGGQRFVTVLHADGLRTSYAFLATIEVHAGQAVAQGDVVGTSGAAVHFGVRRGTVYLDPELLLAGWRAVPRLVPTDGAPRRAGAWDFAARAPPAPGRRRPAPCERAPIVGEPAPIRMARGRSVSAATPERLPVQSPAGNEARKVTAAVRAPVHDPAPAVMEVGLQRRVFAPATASFRRIRWAGERSESAPERRRDDSATMARWPASGGPLDHERPATCGRPPGRGRVRHQNRRKET